MLSVIFISMELAYLVCRYYMLRRLKKASFVNLISDHTEYWQVCYSAPGRSHKQNPTIKRCDDADNLTPKSQGRKIYYYFATTPRNCATLNLLKRFSKRKSGRQSILDAFIGALLKTCRNIRTAQRSIF